MLNRSVHNIRIERLWVDFTQAVGSKWKTFFQDLEAFCRLQIDLDAHIWLVHYLFLGPLNQDIMAWANSWNNHRMQIPGMGHRSPAELRFFNTLLHGSRGQPQQMVDSEEEVLSADEILEYGIDWEAYDNRVEQEAEADDPFPQNPFLTHQPERLSYVEVDESRCPFSDRQLVAFQHNISLLPENVRMGNSLEDRKQLFLLALNIAQQIWNYVV